MATVMLAARFIPREHLIYNVYDKSFWANLRYLPTEEIQRCEDAIGSFLDWKLSASIYLPDPSLPGMKVSKENILEYINEVDDSVSDTTSNDTSNTQHPVSDARSFMTASTTPATVKSNISAHVEPKAKMNIRWLLSEV